MNYDRRPFIDFDEYCWKVVTAGINTEEYRTLVKVHTEEKVFACADRHEQKKGRQHAFHWTDAERDEF